MKALTGLLLVSVWASPLTAQDTTGVTRDSAAQPADPPYRNPKRALILGSLIPGAGHIYAGEYLRGIANYEGTVSAFGLGAMTIIMAPCSFSLDKPTRCGTRPHLVPLLLGVGVVGIGIWEWISSARDAAHAAERANARHLRHRSTATSIIEAPVDSHSGWRVGTEIHF
jgi:hypothetical protein